MERLQNDLAFLKNLGTESTIVGTPVVEATELDTMLAEISCESAIDEAFVEGHAMAIHAAAQVGADLITKLVGREKQVIIGNESSLTEEEVLKRVGAQFGMEAAKDVLARGAYDVKRIVMNIIDRIIGYITSLLGIGAIGSKAIKKIYNDAKANLKRLEKLSGKMMDSDKLSMELISTKVFTEATDLIVEMYADSGKLSSGNEAMSGAEDLIAKADKFLDELGDLKDGAVAAGSEEFAKTKDYTDMIAFLENTKLISDSDKTKEKLEKLKEDFDIKDTQEFTGTALFTELKRRLSELEKFASSNKSVNLEKKINNMKKNLNKIKSSINKSSVFTPAVNDTFTKVFERLLTMMDVGKKATQIAVKNYVTLADETFTSVSAFESKI